MDTDLLLGIDVGTTNCKAVAFDRYGRQAGNGSVPTPGYSPRPNWAEHDPEHLWQAVVAAVRQVLASIDATRVRGVAVASMGEAGVPLDAAGRPTAPIIAWYDSRTVPQHRWWREHVDESVSFGITGLAPNPIFGVYKLMWLRDNMPDAYSSATIWLHVADYIAYRLCGAQATDYSLASRTMLLDLRGRRWSDALVERAGLRRALLPPLVASGTSLGGVTRAAAEQTGLAPGTPVGAGGHDHVCGALASGVARPGTCLDSIGTAEAAFVPIESPHFDDRLRPFGCTYGAHVARDQYFVMGGLWIGGGAIEWAARRLALPTEGPGLYERLQALAATAPAGSLGVFFMPRITTGERGAFVGLTAGADAAALARSVYEGLAYEWRRCFDAIATSQSVQIDQIRVIGGGTRSPLWLQIKADVLGRPLYVLEVEESVALGTALLGGVASGLYPDDRAAAASVQQAVRTVMPDPQRAAFYDRAYHEAYLAVVSALVDANTAIDRLYEGL